MAYALVNAVAVLIIACPCAAHPDSSLSVAEQALDLVVFVGARDKHLYLERGQVKDLSLHDLLGAHKRRDSQNPPDQGQGAYAPQG